jgi:hypothetical protein
MKTIKADLSNEGRLDILERVKAYRGGKKNLITIVTTCILTISGYTREVRISP